jgi:site-specific DNA recombinase
MNESDKSRRGASTEQEAIIYCRVASASADRDVKLLAQEMRCRSYAADNRYPVAKVVHDCPASGARLDRSGVRELFQYLAREKAPGRFVVIVDDLSRLARGVDLYRDFRQALDAVGAKLECRDSGIGPDSDQPRDDATQEATRTRGPQR